MGTEPGELHEEKPDIRYDSHKAVIPNNSIASEKTNSPGNLDLSFVLFSIDRNFFKEYHTNHGL